MVPESDMEQKADTAMQESSDLALKSVKFYEEGNSCLKGSVSRDFFFTWEHMCIGTVDIYITRTVNGFMKKVQAKQNKKISPDKH